MSMIVARMMKLKSGNLNGIGNHNDRRFSKHKNVDIDPERTSKNYDLINRKGSISSDIKDYIEQNKTTKKALRKDAVLVNEWIISSDHSFFENMDEERTKAFFDASVDYFKAKFGAENVRYAVVHMDETTPHMHMGIVPFDEDYKLSAKRVFDRQALLEVQEGLPAHLQAKGFEIERGTPDPERKNLSIPEYKNTMEALKAESKDLRREIKDYKAVKKGVEMTAKQVKSKKPRKGLFGVRGVTVEYVEGLQTTAFNGAVARAKNRASQDEIKNLRAELKRTKAENVELSRKLQVYEKPQPGIKERIERQKRQAEIEKKAAAFDRLPDEQKKRLLAQGLGKKRDFEEIR